VVLLQSGVVPAGMDPEVADPSVFGFWDKTFKADNSPAHFFWDVDRVDSNLLKAPSAPKENVSRTAVFSINTSNVERVTARYRFNPLPYAMLDDLIASGDLAPAIRDRVKTLEIGTPKVWLRSTAVDRCGPPN
jgi:hypothetical protein